jgi:SAM-dependent methyltransferase
MRRVTPFSANFGFERGTPVDRYYVDGFFEAHRSAQSQHVIPSDRYDCFLLPNTLAHVRDLEPALQNAYRILAPGGVILATCPCCVPLIPDGDDYWRMSASGWREVFEGACPGSLLDVASHGNCLTAVAAMYGLAVEELSRAELEHYDRRYPVLVTVSCRKPAS